VSTDAAVFTEPLAAALEIQEQVRIGSNDRVLVVGDGKLGQLVAQTLTLTGCALRVIGRHDAKLALLAARGIETGRADRATRAEFDVAVECTGNPDGFAVAQRALRPARHVGTEEHLRRRADTRCRGGGGERADLGRFALRAVRAGACAYSRNAESWSNR